MNNAVNWFEIFVADLDRAVRFYETTFAIALRREDFAPGRAQYFRRRHADLGIVVIHERVHKQDHRR